jgi:hypothetical protein
MPSGTSTDLTAAPRESSGCVLGISAGLLAVLALTIGTFALRGQALDGSEVLGKHFSVRELPFGLALDTAAALPGGDRVVRLVHPDYVAPEPPKPPEPADASAADETSPESETDGDAAATGGEKDEGGAKPSSGGDAPAWPPKVDMRLGTPPQEVFVILPMRPENVVLAFEGQQSDAFGGGGGGGGRGGGGGGMGMDGMPFGGDGSLAMDRGEVAWGELRAGYRHKRWFVPGGARDEVRVNLSGDGRLCVLVARWPLNHAGDVASVEKLLTALPAR